MTFTYSNAAPETNKLPAKSITHHSPILWPQDKANPVRCQVQTSPRNVNLETSDLTAYSEGAIFSLQSAIPASSIQCLSDLPLTQDKIVTFDLRLPPSFFFLCLTGRGYRVCAGEEVDKNVDIENMAKTSQGKFVYQTR